MSNTTGSRWGAPSPGQSLAATDNRDFPSSLARYPGTVATAIRPVSRLPLFLSEHLAGAQRVALRAL